MKAESSNLLPNMININKVLLAHNQFKGPLHSCTNMFIDRPAVMEHTIACAIQTSPPGTFNGQLIWSDFGLWASLVASHSALVTLQKQQPAIFSISICDGWRPIVF